MIGAKLIELHAVDSTNDYAAKAFSRNEFVDGTVIWAHEQSNGRGQQGNTWSSEPGKNLTITVCLKPRFLPPGGQFLLNKAIALGVLDFIRTCLHGASRIAHPASLIKWPNDLYFGNRKIGGILIENQIMGPVFETSFAGIGININQAHFPPGLPNPVSLIQILHRVTGLKEALLTLCGHLDRRYHELENNSPAGIGQEYNQCLLGFDQWRLFHQDGAEMEGKINGVDDSGRLLVETRNNEILCCSHGEIEYVI